jgi:sec-independent protein translocase protein TatC
VSEGKDDGKMTFLEHLEELRRRLVFCALSVLAGMVICWFFREQIRAFLEAPLYEAWSTVPGLPEPESLRFKSLLEPFVAYLKLSALGGVFLAAPVLMYNLWKFVAPGLYSKEKKMVLPFVFVSCLLFVGGSTMAYSLVFPIGFSFVLNFAAGGEMEKYDATVEILPGAEPQREIEKAVVAKRPEVVPYERVGPVDSGVLDGGPLVVDAGVDGGVTVHGQEVEIADISQITGQDDAGPDPPGEEEDIAWWEMVLNRFLSGSCGTLEAKQGEIETVILTYTWDLDSCINVPELSTLTMGGEDIEVEWTEVEGPPEGTVVFETLDTSLGTGMRDYELSVVILPEGHGKLLPMLMVKDYLSFAIRLLLAFGIVFELPILIVFLALAGIVNYRQLLKFSKWFMVLSVVISAMLTPPDVITQILLATPLTILYFLSILVAYIFGPKIEDE